MGWQKIFSVDKFMAGTKPLVSFESSFTFALIELILNLTPKYWCAKCKRWTLNWTELNTTELTDTSTIWHSVWTLTKNISFKRTNRTRVWVEQTESKVNKEYGFGYGILDHALHELTIIFISLRLSECMFLKFTKFKSQLII